MSRFSSRAILFFIVFAFVLMTTPAYSATITTYNNLSSWQAAVTGVQSVSFQGMVPTDPETVLDGPNTAYTLDGVQFVGLTGSSIGVWDTSYYSWSNYGQGDAFVAQTGSPTSLQITLPSGTTAFSLNLYNSNGNTPSSYTVTGLGTSSITVPTYAEPTLGFLGVTSDTAIGPVTFTLAGNGGYYAWFSNLEWGTAQVTGGSQAPEAGTFLLIGSGLLALAVARRRKAHQSRP